MSPGAANKEVVRLGGLHDANSERISFFSGIHAGIKASRRDLALVFSEVPCVGAGCFTVNRAKAAAVRDAENRLPGRGFRAIVVNSGNANALTGPGGDASVSSILNNLASELRVPPSAILSASTGVIGVPLPVARLQAAFPELREKLSAQIVPAAEAIMTTDTHVKIASRHVQIGSRAVTISAFAKGSGMVAPQLASVLAFLVTDAAVNPSALQSVLQQAVDCSFNNLTVDGDMSTNDCVMILANGLAENAMLDEDVEGFVEFSAAIQSICIELARSVAEDGEGATRLLEVRVDGAPDTRIARDLARAVAGSNLVKAAMFGSDPNWGRILATVGARAGLHSFPVDPLRATVSLQGVSVFSAGAPTPFDPISLRSKLRLPEVAIAIRLAEGDASATAWGCDLTYDYVKINADYASFTIASPDGTVTRDDRLTNYSPAFKRNLVVEALTYISKFSGKRAVIKWGGDLMNKQTLKMSFARDINLLDAVGFLPLVVHGGSREVAATLERFPPTRLSIRPDDDTPRDDDSMTAIRAADSDELKLFEMVLTGKINAELVSLLNHHVIARGDDEPKTRAVGVSGKDGGVARQRTLSENSVHAGVVDSVNPDRSIF